MRHQAINWTNADLLSAGLIGTYSFKCEPIYVVSFKKMSSSAKFQPYCFDPSTKSWFSVLGSICEEDGNEAELAMKEKQGVTNPAMENGSPGPVRNGNKVVRLQVGEAPSTESEGAE